MNKTVNQPLSTVEFIDAVKSLIDVFKLEFGDSWQAAFTSSVEVHIHRV
jgi:hypothetical protein